MREHIGLFRGRRLETTPQNPVWVYGCLLKWPDGDAEICIDSDYDRELIKVSVKPDTVGECTGLRDRNGKLIFEGDIVEGGHFTYEDGLGEIMYDTESARFQIIGREPNNICADFDDYYGREVEVMGNLQDNPELIGGNGDG